MGNLAKIQATKLEQEQVLKSGSDPQDEEQAIKQIEKLLPACRPALRESLIRAIRLHLEKLPSCKWDESDVLATHPS